MLMKRTSPHLAPPLSDMQCNAPCVLGETVNRKHPILRLGAKPWMAFGLITQRAYWAQRPPHVTIWRYERSDEHSAER